MEAGKLKRRIACDEPIELRNDIGESITEFVEAFKVPASVEPLKGRERLLSGQLTAAIDASICMRWSPQTERITPTWRLRHGSRYYNISAPPANVKMANVELEIMATVGLSDAQAVVTGARVTATGAYRVTSAGEIRVRA